MSSRLRLSPFWAGSAGGSSSTSQLWEPSVEEKSPGSSSPCWSLLLTGIQPLHSDELNVYSLVAEDKQRVYFSTSDVSDTPLSKASWLQITHVYSTQKDMMPLDARALEVSTLNPVSCFLFIWPHFRGRQPRPEPGAALDAWSQGGRREQEVSFQEAARV